MKTRILVSFIMLVGFLSPQRSSAQSQSITVIPIVTEADIINATALVDPLSEKVKDIAPTSFSLNIINNRRPDTVWVTMHLEAYVTLDEDGPPAKLIATGDMYRKGAGNDIRTPFPILPTGRLFTSLDAQTGGSRDIDIDSHVDQAMKQRLKDKVSEASSGGRVPSGIYQVIIRFTVLKVGNQSVNEIVDLGNDPRFTVNVTNPTNTTLVDPSENGFEYPTPFPAFRWTYDTRGVKISVYEKRPEHQSLEDAISASDPFLQVEINRKESGNLTIFTYPQAPVGGPGINVLRGPRPLERGKSYVIVLDGTRTAFGYNIDPLRTIRLFRISDPQGQMILNILQTALSGGAYQNFLNIIQDQKLQINSSRLTLNGVTISAQELQVILNQNKDKFKAMRFED
jgi:hypothetical protein